MTTKTKTQTETTLQKLHRLARSAEARSYSRIDSDTGEWLLPSDNHLELAWEIIETYTPEVLPLARVTMQRFATSLEAIQKLVNDPDEYHANERRGMLSSYWQAFGHVAEKLTNDPPRVPTRMTPRQMKDAGATVETICKEWRWFHVNPTTQITTLDVGRAARAIEDGLTDQDIAERRAFDEIQLGLVLSPEDVEALQDSRRVSRPIAREPNMPYWAK